MQRTPALIEQPRTVVKDSVRLKFSTMQPDVCAIDLEKANTKYVLRQKSVTFVPPEHWANIEVVSDECAHSEFYVEFSLRLPKGR